MSGINRVQGFRDTLERATTYDSWGQVLEAADEYQKLEKDITSAIENGLSLFNEHQIKFLSRLTVVVQMRVKASLELNGEVGIRLDQVQKMLPLLDKLPERVPAEFPIHIGGMSGNVDALINLSMQKQQSNMRQKSQKPTKAPVSIPKLTRSNTMDDEDEDDEDDEDDGAEAGAKPGGGSLLPRKRFPANTAISITIERIQIKEPESFIEPYFTVSIHDRDGSLIAGGEPQDTPPTKTVDDNFLKFNQEVHLQVALDALPKGAAIFFELKHYKPKKNKTSTKCFSILEQDELLNGQIPMELYQKLKLQDYKRKKLNLLTDKPHYLYVTVKRIDPQ